MWSTLYVYYVLAIQPAKLHNLTGKLAVAVGMKFKNRTVLKEVDCRWRYRSLPPLFLPSLTSHHPAPRAPFISSITEVQSPTEITVQIS